ncbi:MAG TPA: hypothetical protein VKA88_04370 [Solirubrobacterales bacterium]|nr:hypothetical protein [Solirubrobacterales bacterium]
MTTNREHEGRGAPQRARHDRETDHRDRRRAAMQEAEGHAGSIPRGNQRTEEEDAGRRRGEWDRVLGH